MGRGNKTEGIDRQETFKGRSTKNEILSRRKSNKFSILDNNCHLVMNIDHKKHTLGPNGESGTAQIINIDSNMVN